MSRLAALSALSLIVVLGAFTARLSGTPTLPERPYDYAGIELPEHLDGNQIQRIDNTPSNNPISNAGATLGRVLFYDTRLSANETVSCGTCHSQEDGFSDTDVLSTGFEGGETGRHSMSLAFARYYDNGRFFWDERAATLEEQVLLPIQDAVEMGMTLDGVTARLESTDFYPDLFEDAFGTPEITNDRMARALAQFVRSIVAPNSRYDVAREGSGVPLGRPLAGLTQQENQGLQIFFGQGVCSECHAGELFVGELARNNGLDATVTDEGAGNGRFKTGSMRNIALTAPYMHDGRFSTLEEVVEHYNSGVQNSPNLDRILRQGNQPRRLNLTIAEKAALVAFLNTLTDETLATDPRWSNPFVIDTAAPDPGSGARGLSLDLAGANPVRTQTAFRLFSPTPETATLEVYDVAGRRVAVLFEGPLAEEMTIRWTPEALASGLYLVSLRTASDVVVQRVTVAR